MFKQLCVAIAAISFFNSSFANVTAYTQNNPPAQHKQSDMYPFIINADVLLGKITTQRIEPVTSRINPQAGQVINTAYRLPNQAEIGVRAGVGVGLKNEFNVSFQWTYLRSGDEQLTTIALVGNNDLVTLRDGSANLVVSGNNSSEATFFLKTNYTMHWLDFVMQTAKWMTTSKLRFQPFGGLRYFYFKNRTTGTIADSSNNVVPGATAFNKIHATGAFVGSDLKYLIEKWVHLYSVIYTGVLAGRQTQNQNFMFPTGQNPFTGPLIDGTLNRSKNFTFNPFLVVQFGLGTQFSLWNDSVMTLRIFYELFSMSTDVALVPEEAINDEITYIQTQVGGLGLTIVF